jgi:hypothetical protein
MSVISWAALPTLGSQQFSLCRSRGPSARSLHLASQPSGERPRVKFEAREGWHAIPVALPRRSSCGGSMRLMTVSDIKFDRVSARQVPAEGTKVRATYDLFMAHKGEPISFSRDRHHPFIIDRLVDTWGLDIRRIGKGRYLLAGEWFGIEYVDYVALRFHALERGAALSEHASAATS